MREMFGGTRNHLMIFKSLKIFYGFPRCGYIYFNSIINYLKEAFIFQKGRHVLDPSTAQKMKLFVKDFFSKFYQIRSKLEIWSHLLRKSLMENFIFFVQWLLHETGDLLGVATS